MSSIPRIKISDVINWTDDAYFKRGQGYYASGAIYEQRREGMKIKSKCSGSQAPFYRQEVSFNSKGIESAECSCPVGDGGRCKHAIALLLTWVNDPDSFQETEALEAILDKRSKPELIAIIKEMLEQEPDLESLLDLPVIGEESKPINIKVIRQQAQRAFRDVDYEWGYTEEIKRDLNPLLKLAAGYLSCGDAENSALIYMTVIEAILNNENAAMGDEEGRLLGVSFDCAEALGNCLPSINDRKKRLEILQVLFSVYQWDIIRLGGVGAADCVPEILVGKTTPDERIEIAKWTRKIMPKGNDWSAGYHREVLGRLLLDLEVDFLDDEAYLKICRQTGRLNDLVERLLKLKRTSEAEDAARQAEDYPLLNVLRVFMQYNQANLAEKLVTERLNTVRNKELDGRLIEWLANRLKERGDLAGSLKLEERLFWEYPNLEKYKKLHKLARQINKWETLRAQIIMSLEQKKNFDFLVELYLHEKEVANALITLEKLPQRWGDHELHIEVAKAAKKQYPQEAIQIFRREAERFIGYRDRGNYLQAALCLREVRNVYHGLKDFANWEKLIADIRQQYKKLPALQDELNKLKL